MKKQNDGQVKTSKPYAMSPGKKFILALVAFGSAIGSMFGFAGCVPKNTPTPTPTPDPEPNPPIVIVENIKFSDFITDHADVASNFVEDFIRPNVAQGKEVRAESWAIKADVADESIKEFEIVYVYDIDETQRGIESATVTLDNAVSLNDIVENKINAGEIKVNVKTTPISTFDAKENNSNIDMSSFTDETVVYSKDYVKETFEAEKPIDPNPPVNPDIPVISNTEIIEALDTNCSTGMINRCFLGMDVNTDNISNEEWFLIKNEDGKIVGAEYSCNYQATNSNSYYARGKVMFENPISEEDLSNGNIGKTTYTRIYRTNFNHNIQDEKKELTDAICDKFFKVKDNSIRYISTNDRATIDPELGEIKTYTVIEISDNEIEEKTIVIKNGTLNEIISNLDIESNYRITSKNSYELSGNKVDANKNVNANMIDLFENEDDMTM